MDVFAIALIVGEALDLIGVFVILIGVIIATAVFLKDVLMRKMDGKELYKSFRANLGKSILIGLEFLVAGDIIRSVVGQPSFASVGILAVIVLIRTFLSITFDMEISGHWPWNKK